VLFLFPLKLATPKTEATHLYPTLSPQGARFTKGEHKDLVVRIGIVVQKSVMRPWAISMSCAVEANGMMSFLVIF